MAQESEQLPDLWAIAQRLITSVKQLFNAQRQQLQQRLGRDIEPSSALAESEIIPGWGNQSRQANVADPVRVRPAKYEKPDTVVASSEQHRSAQSTLLHNLHDANFLRQAVIINEILDRPLALRRQRVWRRR